MKKKILKYQNLATLKRICGCIIAMFLYNKVADEQERNNSKTSDTINSAER